MTTLSAAGHAGVVRDIFTTSHSRYDLLNHLLSLRRDVGWRAAAVRAMRFPPRGRLLDVATGTADLALAAARRHRGITVCGVDIAEPMLRQGRKKITRGGLAGRVALRAADVAALPYPEASFDVTAAAFGMRNFPDKSAALAEMARVTAPGGQVMVLEMSYAPSRGFAPLYGFYLRRVLPRAARLLARNPAAYLYLADSILGFPKPDAFSQLMRQAGLQGVEYRSLSFGAAHLHVGRVPGAAREGT
jgi:demethylmenaquinone methyltransferase / 2-methoxy-6-polyprenyl-1,4-benzoquinol methylase